MHQTRDGRAPCTLRRARADAVGLKRKGDDTRSVDNAALTHDCVSIPGSQSRIYIAHALSMVHFTAASTVGIIGNTPCHEGSAKAASQQIRKF